MTWRRALRRFLPRCFWLLNKRRRPRPGGLAPRGPLPPARKIILLPDNDLNYRAARRAKAPPDTLVVHGHGSPDRVAGLDAAQLAELIRQSGQWQAAMRIKLDACWTGSRATGIAAQLAEILQTEVLAPTTRTLTCGPVDIGPWHSFRVPRSERAVPYWPGRWVRYRPASGPPGADD